MVLPRNPHLTPTTPVQTPANDGQSTIGAVRAPSGDSTFGLHHSWQPVLAWARQHRVLYEALALIEVGLSPNKPRVFGTQLAEIASDVAAVRLSVWSESSVAAHKLHRLSLAARLHPEIFQVSPVLTRSISARTHLGEGLERDYILALALEGWQGIADEQQRAWIATLRAWTLVQAMERAQRRILQDRNLRELATGLRLACERDVRRREAIADLMTPLEDFPDINRHLATVAVTLAKRSPRPDPPVMALLRAITAVARGDDAVDTTFGASGIALAGGEFNLTQEDEIFAPLALAGEVAPEVHVFPTGNAEDDAEDGNILVGVDANESYSRQRLKSGAVWMLAAEDQQYLPWSWSRPNPNEIRALHRWIDGLSRHEVQSMRTLAALSWIAVAIGRSLKQLGTISIDAVTSDEWQLDPKTLRLHRRPPRRRGWQPDSLAERAWVRPVAEGIAIELPRNIADVLRELLLASPKATILTDLWSGSDEISAAWGKALPADLSRLTPGMLAQVLPQRLLELTGDAAFARVIASHPSTALPGACAYAAWSRPYVECVLADQPPGGVDLLSSEPIGGGSRLDPIEALLVDALATAAHRLDEKRRCGSPPEYHNAYSAYCTVLLLAATGVRPVADPFESPLHFDLEGRFAYVDDKGSDEAHAGRLVPLVKPLCDLLAEGYPAHLRQMALVVEASNPPLAADIRALADGKPTGSMPYFFLLDAGSAHGWMSVSEAAIDILELFDWPLPLRLFRHRLSIRLRAL